MSALVAGCEVAAVVQLAAGARVTAHELREWVGASLARFKAPRAVLVCERVPRHADGKADYRTAHPLVPDAVDATSASEGRSRRE